MKRRIFTVLLCMIVLSTMLVIAVGCDFIDDVLDKINFPSSNKEYTIMYSDGSGTHTLTVKKGDLYSIPEPLPSKNGYDFIGLYDAEVGGTQYVNAQGICVSAFSEKRNLVLYPQYAPKKYRITLEYGNAIVTGDRFVDVEYGKDFPLLPSNLRLDGNEYILFSGWYTEENSKGVKVSGSDGIPTVTVNELINDDYDATGITLYAGFDVRYYTITYFVDSEELSLSVTYGKRYSLENVPKKVGYRFLGLYNRESGGIKFVDENGNSVAEYAEIEDITLYARFVAIEYEFVLNYGEAQKDVVNTFRCSYDKALPNLPSGLIIADKDYMIFQGWYTERNLGGIKVTNSDGSPLVSSAEVIGDREASERITLYACFEAKKYTVTYYDDDERIELEVKCEEYYTLIYVPQKGGYTFDGLYDTVGNKYVDGQGKSLTPYKEREDIELVARFSPIEYSFSLDYQKGTSESLVRTVKAKYGERIDSLPSDLYIANEPYMFFSGWYTATERGGIKVSDDSGKILASVADIVGTNYSKTDIKLYAGYLEKYNKVSLYSYDGERLLKTAQCKHGMSLSTIYNLLYGISDRGNNIYEWSDKIGGAAYEGEVWADMSLYAVRSNTNVSFDVANCSDNNGYDPTRPTDNGEHRQSHNGFEMVRLQVDNYKGTNSNGAFVFADGGSVNIYLQVMQDMNDLPINVDADYKKIGNDSYDGDIYNGLRLQGRAIGYGAFYLTIVYTDGSIDTVLVTDFLNGKSRYDRIDLGQYINKNKTLRDFDVVVMYEMEYGKNGGFLGVGSWRAVTNWRCHKKLIFV